MVDYEKIFDITAAAYEKYSSGRYQHEVCTTEFFVKKSVKNSVYGSDDYGLISDKFKTFWVRIPKCANSFIDRNINETCRRINFLLDYKKFGEPSDYRGCVVLRHPFKRWISAACTIYRSDIANNPESVIDESAYITLLKNKFLAENLIENYINKLIFDYHGMLQSYYLYPCEIRNLDFFYLNDNTGYHLNKWFLSNGVNNTLDINKWGATDTNDYFYQFLVSFLTDSSNEKYKSKIINFLKPDYELIEAVNFYNRH